MYRRIEILRAPEGAAAGGTSNDAGASQAGAASQQAAASASAADRGGADAGAAAKGADAATAAQQDGLAATVQDTKTPPAGASYRPDGLPDHFAGATDKETIDKLYKAVNGFRQSKFDVGDMPADAKGYQFEPTDVVKPYVTDLGKDPFMAKVQEAAFQRGIPSKQFNAFINDVLGEMVAGQMVDAPFDAEKERAALLPNVQDPKERATAADRMANEAIARVKAWKDQGMPEALANDLLSRMDRATTIQLVKYIDDGRREAAPAMGGAPSGGITQADLTKRQADPRGRLGSPTYDKAFVAETDRLYRQLYGAGNDR